MKEGFEHLQCAALELIAAARAFLDVAEEACKDPAELLNLASEAAGLARTMRGGVRTERVEDQDPGVQRIRVS